MDTSAGHAAARVERGDVGRRTRRASMGSTPVPRAVDLSGGPDQTSHRWLVRRPRSVLSTSLGRAAIQSGRRVDRPRPPAARHDAGTSVSRKPRVLSCSTHRVAECSRTSSSARTSCRRLGQPPPRLHHPLQDAGVVDDAEIARRPASTGRHRSGRSDARRWSTPSPRPSRCRRMMPVISSKAPAMVSVEPAIDPGWPSAVDQPGQPSTTRTSQATEAELAVGHAGRDHRVGDQQTRSGPAAAVANRRISGWR